MEAGSDVSQVAHRHQSRPFWPPSGMSCTSSGPQDMGVGTAESSLL